MRVLLVSTYELGHQPLHAAAPAAALRDAGHEVRCVDTSVEPWDDRLVAWADAAAFSVPMHTAMRLAIPLARRARATRPDLPVCFYGLYAPVGRDLTVRGVADHVVAGRYLPGVLRWAETVAAGRPAPPDTVAVGRGAAHPPLPARDLLPPLDRYAHLALGGEERPVGYVEATEGCLHECRHCPVPVVYGGRFRAVAVDAVLADVEQLVAAGARHLTFGDPDFLNGPAHALRVVREVSAAWPDLTFDVTTKVDHVVAHTGVWPELAAAGCLFVTTAVELVNDAILARLDKGHTTAQTVEAVRLLRRHGIEPRPSLLPFTPWTSLGDLRELLDFVAAHDLIGNVEPVMWSIRLLLPEASLLLDHPDLAAHLGPYDAERLTYTWTAADHRVDVLQRQVAARVEAAAAAGADALETFLAVDALVAAAGGGRPREPQLLAGSVEGRPRLTEPWFC